MNSVHTRPGQENSKKNAKKLKKKTKKPISDIIFSQKGDEIGGEREKKVIHPNSVHSRPGQENSKKNIKRN